MYCRVFLPNSHLNSSYGLLTAPISELSVTWGAASQQVRLSLSFKLDVVGIESLFFSMYLARYSLATTYSYDFSALNSHDLAKLSGGCRSARSKARAKGLWCVPRVLVRVPDGGRKNNRIAIFINFSYLR